MVSWENSPKKEGAYLKGKLTLRDYKRTLIDYNRLQKSDIDCKVYQSDYKRLQKLDMDYKFYS